jgi:hypothetical protein
MERVDSYFHSRQSEEDILHHLNSAVPWRGNCGSHVTLTVIKIGHGPEKGFFRRQLLSIGKYYTLVLFRYHIKICGFLSVSPRAYSPIATSWRRKLAMIWKHE